MAGVGNYIHYWYKSYQIHGTTESGNDTADYQSIFNMAKARLLKKVKARPSQSNPDELGETLTNILYNKNNSIQPNYEVITTLMGAISLKYVVNLTQEKGLSAYERKIGTKSFDYSTVKKLKGDVDRLLNQIGNNSNATALERDIEKLRALEQQLKNLDEQLQQVYGQELPGGFKVNTQYSGTRDIIRNINESLANISNATAVQAIGTAFEAFLASLSDSFDEKVLDWATVNIDKILTGKQVTTNVTGAKIDREFVTDQFVLEQQGTKVGISLDGEFTGGKQMKMDVNLSMDDIGRVSAKNYKVGDRIGAMKATSLLTILQKNLTADEINHYLNAATTHSNANKPVIKAQRIAHDFAKTVIAAEGIAGVSQANGYADTFIVNMRGSQKVMAISLSELLDNLNVNPDRVRINGYKESPDIWIKMNTWQKASKKGSGQKYAPDTESTKKRISALLTKVHALKVSVQVDALTKN